MHGMASAVRPCRRSWMTRLSACGCDLVTIQVNDNVTTPSWMLAPGNLRRARHDIAVTVGQFVRRTLSLDFPGVNDEFARAIPGCCARRRARSSARLADAAGGTLFAGLSRPARRAQF